MSLIRVCTNAVVANLVELSLPLNVIDVGSPVNDGETKSAFKFMEVSVCDLLLEIVPAFACSADCARATSVSKFVETSPIKVVTVVEKLTSFPSAVAMMDNVVNDSGASPIISSILDCTNSVFANCRERLPEIAVFALGAPPKVGESKSAFKFREISVCDLLLEIA